MHRESADLCRQKADWKGAEDHLRALLAQEPLDYESWWRLSEATALQRRFQEALECASRAVQIDATCHYGWYFLANAYAALGRWDACRAASDRCLEIAPGFPAAHWLRAHGCMWSGEWREAWASYEYGILLDKRKPRCIGPQWDGSPLPGKTLFVWCEQGNGDCIQYARFLKNAATRAGEGARVVCEWRPLLLRLCSHLADGALAQPPDRVTPVRYDTQVSLLSLPFAMGLSEADIDGAPYLQAEPIDALRGKVGLCWRGSGAHANDVNRSLPDQLVRDAFEPFASRLVAVQPNDVPRPFAMADASAYMVDFAGTARVLASLDLLITVDTATAHLAGALGVPTWMLPPRGNTEARWGAGEFTPWYDSWRLYQSPGGWEPTLSRLTEDLRAL